MSTATTFDLFANQLANWTTTPVIYENENAEPIIENDPPAFVYVEIYGDEFDQETTGSPGSNIWLERGMTWLHVMTKSGTGSRQARVYAKQLLDLFREQNIGGLDMTRMSIGAGDPGQNFPNYYALTATIEWHRREIAGA